MNKEKAEKLFVEVARVSEDAYEIKDGLRSLNSNDELSDEEYNYLLGEWDNILKKNNL